MTKKITKQNYPKGSFMWVVEQRKQGKKVRLSELLLTPEEWEKVYCQSLDMLNVGAENIGVIVGGLIKWV